MIKAVFIGDEFTAAALRLAGARVQTPAMSDVPRVFTEVLGDAEFVIVAADYARAIDEGSLRAAIRRADPLVFVMPDGGNRYQPEDLEARVDRVLGIEQ